MTGKVSGQCYNICIFFAASTIPSRIRFLYLFVRLLLYLQHNTLLLLKVTCTKYKVTDKKIQEADSEMEL